MAKAKDIRNQYIVPPDKFSFVVEEWPQWKRRFIRYMSVTSLNQESDAHQIEMLIYIMGDQAEDALLYSGINEKVATFNETLEAFDQYFLLRSESRYHRIKFSERIQQPEETIDDYIKTLFELSKKCDFEHASSVENRVADQVVKGLRDKALSLNMQLDSLTLADIVAKCGSQQRISSRSDLAENTEQAADSNWHHASALDPVFIHNAVTFAADQQTHILSYQRGEVNTRSYLPIGGCYSVSDGVASAVDVSPQPSHREKHPIGIVDPLTKTIEDNSSHRLVSSTKSTPAPVGPSYDRNFILSLHNAPTSRIRPLSFQNYPELLLARPRKVPEIFRKGKPKPNCFKECHFMNVQETRA